MIAGHRTTSWDSLVTTNEQFYFYFTQRAINILYLCRTAHRVSLRSFGQKTHQREQKTKFKLQFLLVASNVSLKDTK